MWPFARKNETLEKLKDLKKSVLEIKDLSQSRQLNIRETVKGNQQITTRDERSC